MNYENTHKTPRLQFVERYNGQGWDSILQQWCEGTKGGERWEGWIDVPRALSESSGDSSRG